MEMKLKDRLLGKSLSGFVKNVEAFYQRMNKVSAKASNVDVADLGSYEMSKEHQVHLAEVECERSQALEEARRSLVGRC